MCGILRSLCFPNLRVAVYPKQVFLSHPIVVSKYLSYIFFLPLWAPGYHLHCQQGAREKLWACNWGGSGPCSRWLWLLTSSCTTRGRTRCLLRFLPRQRWGLSSLHLLHQYPMCKFYDCDDSNMPTTIHFLELISRNLGSFLRWGGVALSMWDDWNSNPDQSGIMTAASTIHTTSL